MFLFIQSCSKDSLGPEQILETVVNSAMNGDKIPQRIEAYLTPKFKEKLESSIKEDEQSLQINDLSISKINFKILSKNCTESSRCHLIYTTKLSQEKKGEKVEYNTMVKKTAVFVQIDGQWMIDDIFNLKTYLNQPEI